MGSRAALVALSFPPRDALYVQGTPLGSPQAHEQPIWDIPFLQSIRSPQASPHASPDPAAHSPALSTPHPTPHPTPHTTPHRSRSLPTCSCSSTRASRPRPPPDEEGRSPSLAHRLASPPPHLSSPPPRPLSPRAEHARLRELTARELEAKRQVVRLQRSLAAHRLAAASTAARRRNLRAAAEVRREAEARRERHALDTTRVPADEAAARAVAERIRARLRHLFADATDRSWFKLFKKFDLDATGLLSYAEFERMVRRELRLLAHQLSDAQLLSAWLCFDADGSGHLSAGEFGRMLRLGQRGARASPPRQEWGGGRGEEAAALAAGARIHARVEQLFPLGVGVYGDGPLQRAELEEWVRDGLQLREDEVAEGELRCVWEALEREGEGRVDERVLRGWLRRCGARRGSARHEWDHNVQRSLCAYMKSKQEAIERYERQAEELDLQLRRAAARHGSPHGSYDVSAESLRKAVASR